MINLIHKDYLYSIIILSLFSSYMYYFYFNCGTNQNSYRGRKALPTHLIHLEELCE